MIKMLKPLPEKMVKMQDQMDTSSGLETIIKYKKREFWRGRGKGINPEDYL